jgi:glycosyltransferase involved in cell wall biosynthesis
LRLFAVSISGIYPFDENGPGIALYAMLKGLLEMGHLNSDEITMELLIGTRNRQNLDSDWHSLLNVPMVPILCSLESIKGLKTPIKGCLEFINKIKNADIIFYNSPTTDAITFTYPYITRLAKKKQIYYLHGSLVNERVNSTARKYFHLIAHAGLIDRVIIPLESFKIFVSRIICPYEIIVAIPECVITPWYEDSHKISLEGDPVLLYAGRLAQVKRVDILLKAFSILVSQYPSAKLYLAGSGPLESSLKKLCTELRLSGKVAFLGHMPHNKLRSLYRSSDIFVLPSDAEFMSISLLEAMASKCAVVASDIAATEVVENGQNGLVFPRGDFKTLANNLSILADDAALRKKLSSEAYLTVKKKFDYRIVGSKLLKEMHNILYNQLNRRKARCHK